MLVLRFISHLHFIYQLKCKVILKGAIKALDVVEGQSIAFNVVNGQVVLEAVKTTDDNENDRYD